MLLKNSNRKLSIYLLCSLYITIYSCKPIKTLENNNDHFNVSSTKFISTDYLDVANYIISTKDSGYVVAGYKGGKNRSNYIGLIAKLNNLGDTLWTRTYREKGDNRAWSIAETGKGDLMVTGFSNSFTEQDNQDVWLSKINANGDLLWEKNFGGSGDDLAWDIKKTKENNFIIAAQTNSKGNGNFDAWFILVDEDGNVLWENTYGSEGRERIFSVTQGIDGILYATGIHTSGPADAPIDVYTIAVNPKDGLLVWEDYLDKGNNDTGHGVVYGQRGGVWVTGYTESVGKGGQDGFLMKYDKKGKLKDFFTYGGTGNDRIMNVTYNNKSEILLVGYSSSFSSSPDNFDIWVAKTNEKGEKLANFNFPGNGFDRGVHTLENEKHFFVVGTYVPKSKTDDPDLIVLRLESEE